MKSVSKVCENVLKNVKKRTRIFFFIFFVIFGGLWGAKGKRFHSIMYQTVDSHFRLKTNLSRRVSQEVCVG